VIGGSLVDCRTATAHILRHVGAHVHRPRLLDEVGSVAAGSAPGAIDGRPIRE
jgi:hypothetical protein